MSRSNAAMLRALAAEVESGAATCTITAERSGRTVIDVHRPEPAPMVMMVNDYLLGRQWRLEEAPYRALVRALETDLSLRFSVGVGALRAEIARRRVS